MRKVTFLVPLLLMVPNPTRCQVTNKHDVAQGEYYVAYQPDLQTYPNYSFEIGDLDGDGRMELVSLDQTGNRLRAITLEGREVFEKRLNNNALWGTALIAVTDLNGDGRAEVAVPASTDRIKLFNGKGQQMAEYVTGSSAKDHFGMGIPLLAPFRCSNKPGLIAAVAGGRIVALDGNLKELWRKEGFRHDFGHEFFVADIDGDGFDEVAFITVDNINKGLGPDNHGDLVILDHDGRVILRERVDRYWPDSHFDSIGLADFRGIGKTEVLLEKGILINLHGDVVWDASKNFEHGQWIAHFADPSGKGQRIVISELWGKGRKNVILSGNGEVLATITNPARTELDQATFPHWVVRPTRCHVVRWTPDAAPEIFLGEQAVRGQGPPGPSYDLKLSFVDIDGRLLGVLPFRDRQVEGYFYNAEVHSRVADVDGDGRQEVVFPRQDGHVMVIKKREKGKK